MSIVTIVPDTPVKHIPRSREDKKFLGIQILRGIAVLFTVMAHVPATTYPFAAFSVPAPWWIGVPIFYGISGWIIAHVTRTADAGEVASFLTRRIFRIVPILAASLLLSLAFALVLPHGSGVGPIVDQFYPDIAATGRIAAANLLFLADLADRLGIRTPYSLLGLWSIAVEVKFYIVYALLLVLAPRSRTTALAVLLVGVFAVRCHSVLADGAPTAYSHMFFVELFCAGALSYRFRERFRSSIAGQAAAWACILSFPILEFHGAAFLVHYLLLIAAVVYVVNCMAAALVTGAGRLSNAFIWIGERSYTIYVFHFQLLAIAGVFTQLRGINLFSPPLYNIVLIGGLLLGLPVIELLYRTIEKGGIQAGARLAAYARA